jgi:gluconokinase
MIVVVMGVTGVGKTTIGSELARRLNCAFEDADSYHSAANIEKMAHGIPLTDADRIPWLEAMRAMLGRHAAEGLSVVLACSALRQSYRDILGKGLNVSWIYLKASAEVIRQRIEHRHGHFAKEDLLRSQFETLEEPKDVLVVNAELPEEQVAAEAMQKLRQANQANS